jgi:hypothetical protein
VKVPVAAEQARGSGGMAAAPPVLPPWGAQRGYSLHMPPLDKSLGGASRSPFADDLPCSKAAACGSGRWRRADPARRRRHGERKRVLDAGGRAVEQHDRQNKFSTVSRYDADNRLLRQSFTDNNDSKKNNSTPTATTATPPTTRTLVPRPSPSRTALTPTRSMTTGKATRGP